MRLYVGRNSISLSTPNGLAWTAVRRDGAWKLRNPEGQLCAGYQLRAEVLEMMVAMALNRHTPDEEECSVLNRVLESAQGLSKAELAELAERIG